MVWKFAFNYEIKEGRGEKGRRAGESEEEGGAGGMGATRIIVYKKHPNFRHGPVSTFF